MPVGRQFLSAFLLVLLGAGALRAQAPGVVTGRVVDSATDQPIPGALVTVGGRRVNTDENGRFAVTGVPAGTTTVSVTNLGYRDLTHEVTVESGQTAVMDFRMPPQAFQLRGLVVTGYGARRARDLTGSINKISGEQFNTGRVVSPEQLIQGKIAGVNVVDSNEPGSSMNIRIRGGTSVTSSNEPLFVVDGVPLAIGGGISAGRNPLNFLNPDEVASVTVLKDASATAIYGSRGANGVVIVETKKAAPGTDMTYTGSISGSTITRRPEMLGTQEFRSAVSQYDATHGTTIMSRLGNANTDWRDAILRDAGGQEHSFAISRLGDDYGYRLSLGYMQQQGILADSRTERASVGINYNQALFNERLNVRANVKGSRTADQFVPGGVLGSATGFAPTQPIRDASSPFGGYFEWSDPMGPNNPIAELELSTEKGTTYRSVGNVESRYRLPILENKLIATLNLGYDVTKAEREMFYPSDLKWQVEGGYYGEVRRRNPTQMNRILDAYLNYATHLDRFQSDIDVTGGYSYEDSRSDFPEFYARQLSFDLLGPDGVPAAKDQGSTLTVDESRLISGFGRINYTFRDKYLLTASVRRDGSSKFGPGNQWGTFPSAAFAWRVSEEPFMDRFESLSDLKLRLSWGKNGNQAFDNYQAFARYMVGDQHSQVQFGNEWVTTIRPAAYDPGIKWEETTSYNAGFDYGFLNNRFTGTFDVYRKDTKDLIFTVPVAAGTAVSNYLTTNIGSMRNQGVEFGIGARILDGGETGLTWIADLNASYNQNELTEINPFAAGSETILMGDIGGAVGNKINVLTPGEPVCSFFTYRQKGALAYEDRNGDGNIDENDLYEDLNGDGKVNQDDREPYKSPDPKWMFGHTSRMTWRAFDMSFTMRAHLGNWVYNNVASNYGHYSALSATGAPANLEVSVLETKFDNPQYFSPFYVQDASFLRMDNLTIGYTLTPFGSERPMRVFGTLQNVFTLTGYDGVDPSAGVNGIDNTIYPRSRTLTVGASASF